MANEFFTHVSYQSRLTIERALRHRMNYCLVHYLLDKKNEKVGSVGRKNSSSNLREVRSIIRELNKLNGKLYRFDYRKKEIYISWQKEESRYEIIQSCVS